MLSAAVITTFGDDSWNLYAKSMLQSFVQYWPKEVPIMVKLDTSTLAPEVNKVLREYDGLACGWEKEHAEFVERHKGKDDPTNYRKQVVRFCHKIFAIKYALEAVRKAKAAGDDGIPRYLIWLDADVLTTRPVSVAEIEACLPKEGDAVSYLGRKDWPHSECGWLAFDLDNGGANLIDLFYSMYTSDSVLNLEELHDSWVFDHISGTGTDIKRTNLSPNAVGMEVWPQSPMAAWSRHYKGPVAKNELAQQKNEGMRPLKIQTQNAIPHEDIRAHIEENQKLIKNWIVPCTPTDEEIVVVSAGPMLVPEDIEEEIKSGRKIVAVKHALKPLREVGIIPWATILLDPRPHVYEFVDEIDPSTLCFVASQVDPKVTQKLLDRGCTIWGYHASVGAGEASITEKQEYSIVNGGSATATRGLAVLDKLGFHRFRLYGYDLCFGKKPDMDAVDQYGQKAHMHVEVGYQLQHHKDFRWFYSKPELLAQADEFRQLMENQSWEIKAFGDGIVPFLYNIRRVNDLRKKRKLDKIAFKEVSYKELLCNKIPLSAHWRNMRSKIRLKAMKASSY